MAEYKTYTCDVCQEHKAERFKIPHVDDYQDPVEGSKVKDGYVDLCPKHAVFFVQKLFNSGSLTKDIRRQLWKSYHVKAV